MKQRLKQLVEKHIEKIDNEDFFEVFDEILKKDWERSSLIYFIARKFPFRRKPSQKLLQIFMFPNKQIKIKQHIFLISI